MIWIVFAAVIVGTSATVDLPNTRLMPDTSKTMTYDDSLVRCKNASMTPYMPKTRAQWEAMADALANMESHRMVEVWVPATDREREGTLLFEDGTAVDTNAWNWHKNQKLKYNSDKRDCVVMGRGPNAPALMLKCSMTALPMICV
ncbi:unnamed protein product [Meganyctiphanes norvegica]|uniref:C-type lectin domain-containing protein n=1 Tax=Meganyctiphanes norvegica TaxID=48144 RepID=A0AAV2PLN1_MEGNR